MCDPFSMFVAATAASTLTSAAGSIAAGNAQASAANANARMLDEQAKSRIEKGKFDVATAERTYERTKGSNLARIASSNVSAESYYAVLADDAAEASLERAAIKYGAKAEADNLKFQAYGQRQEAKAAKTGAAIGAVGHVISGVASVYSSPFAQSSSAGSPWLTTVYPTLG